MSKQIIIAQRGWVFVGDVQRADDDVTITNAQCIRRWGTTRGLGELARGIPVFTADQMRLRRSLRGAFGPWDALAG